MRSIRITRTRPAEWPHPDDVAGRYETVFGVLVITDKGVSKLEENA